MNRKRALLIHMVLCLSVCSLIAEEKQLVVVYRFTLDNDILPAAGRLVDHAVEEAESRNADILFMRLNTFGGLVNIADSIRTKLLNTRLRTVVWIDKNAASAGALISIACDSIYMARGASIGAATVVNQTGEKMPDKYQSYMRALMRATAEAKGRDPKIAEAMVDERVSIPGIIDSGYTLTFTTQEAIKHGYAEGEANSFEEVMQLMGIQHYITIDYEIDWLEKIINFLMHPVVSGLLMLVIIGGIYFELQTPGVGFPLVAAAVAALLYFAPLYLEGLAEHWEVLLFVIGMILLGVEILVLPGFGIAGISGIILIITGLTLSLIRNVSFDFSMTGTREVALALFRVVITIVSGLAMLLLFGRNIFQSKLFGKIILKDTQQVEAGYVSVDISLRHLIGRKAVTVTDLKPSGKIEIDGERYDAYAEGLWISAGTPVMIVHLNGNTLVVEKTDDTSLNIKEDTEL